MTGVEPAYAAWEAAVLPMNYIRKSVEYYSSLSCKMQHEKRRCNAVVQHYDYSKNALEIISPNRSLLHKSGSRQHHKKRSIIAKPHANLNPTPNIKAFLMPFSSCHFFGQSLHTRFFGDHTFAPLSRIFTSIRKTWYNILFPSICRHLSCSAYLQSFCRRHNRRLLL